MEKRDRTKDFIIEKIENKPFFNLRTRDVKLGKFFFFKNNITYNSLRGFCNALRHFNMTTKEFYDTYYKKENEGICKYNSNYTTKFLSLPEGYSEYCNKCPECRIDINHKLKIAANKESVKKAKYIKRMKFYEEHPGRYIIQAKKALKTKRKKYGENFQSELTKKQWEKCTPEQRKLITEKANRTKTKNDTHMNGKNCKVCCGFAYKRLILGNKEYIFQGYEDIILTHLYNKNIDFLNGKKCPRIKTKINKTGYHRPDVYIPSLNTYIEVKSGWTWKISYKNILQVAEDINKMGIHYCVFVLKNKNKSELDLLDKYLDMIISSQASTRNEEGSTTKEDIPVHYKLVFGSGSARVPGFSTWNVI